LKEKLQSPERPYIAILGGAKVSDKIPVLKGLVEKVDGMIIGGAMAYTFLSSKGFGVGNSLIEKECYDVAKEIMKGQKRETFPFFFQLTTFPQSLLMIPK